MNQNFFFLIVFLDAMNNFDLDTIFLEVLLGFLKDYSVSSSLLHPQ